MNRRSVIAMPAVLAAAPAAALGWPRQAEASEILRLYDRWCAISDAANSVDDVDLSDEELDRLFYDERDQVEVELMAAPCTCAADFAIKAIINTARGQVLSDWNTGALWTEARTLIEQARKQIEAVQ